MRQEKQKEYTISEILERDIVLINELETINIPKYKMPLEIEIGMKIVIDKNGCFQKS